MTAFRAASRRAVPSGYAPATSSPFHSTAVRGALKETDNGEFQCLTYYPCGLFPFCTLHIFVNLALAPGDLYRVPDRANDTPTDRDGLPEYYEQQKEELLKSLKEGKAKWKAELASNSEAEVCDPDRLSRAELIGFYGIG